MSDFIKLMEAMSGDTIDDKIKTFSDALDKITQFSVNSIDQMTKRVQKVNQLLDALEKRLVQVEQRPRAPANAGGTAPSAPGALEVPPPMPGAGTPTPPPEPRPANPMSARSALQNELKNLFAKKKQLG